jgi:simple sugar transport system ATP-binding protein
MLALCDKIMVMCHGRLQGVVNSTNTTKEDIGLMMTGALNIVNKEGKTDGIAADSAFEDKKEDANG